jgi:hypothetical protein
MPHSNYLAILNTQIYTTNNEGVYLNQPDHEDSTRAIYTHNPAPCFLGKLIAVGLTGRFSLARRQQNAES